MPILTLTTDIGQRDYIVGAIKGQFVKLMPNLNTVDITHYLSQTNLPVAAYTCYNAFKYYPEKTYHLVLINVFESSLDYFLIANIDGQYIICADNGLITMMLGERPAEVVRIPVSRNSSLLTMTQDIAASIFKLEEYGKLSAVGAMAPQIVEKYPLRPTAGPDWIEGQILFIDNFENVVINITRKDFEEHRKGRSFRIMFQRNESIEKLSNNYASVPEHEKIAWFNSAGYLEISLRNGNMAGLFGLQGYNEQMQQSGIAAGNKWFYQTIRIFFE
jgi:S-adenosyl-L-methionine hydrolase (adenosine-forming)